MDKKKALLFIFKGYCEFEITTAISILRTTHEMHTFSIDHTPCKSEAGLTTIPDFSINELNPEDYDVVIIPGGDLRPIAEAEELFHFVKAFTKKGKVAAAICSGVYVLGKAGVLTKKRYTVTLTAEQREFLGCFNEDNYVYKSVVKSENILTAQGHAYVQFGIELAKMLREVNQDTIYFYKGNGNSYMEKDC